MDDYMKEMMDLKTLVTKSLEKKGVLARIRAELRANVFQAIEEQDHITESEGGDSFALLGGCSERAKQLHATPAGKLLTGLVCEYLEWCELERTLRVYSPELNQPRPYSRSELEELLEIKTDKNVGGVSSETRPLLLEVLEGYLKSEQTTLVKDSYAVASSSYPKSSRVSSSAGSRPLINGLDIGHEELRGVLESRLTLSNKGADLIAIPTDVTDEKHSAVPLNSETCVSSKVPGSIVRICRDSPTGPDKVSISRSDEVLKDIGKPGARPSLKWELPPIRRTAGLGTFLRSNSTGSNDGIIPAAGGTREPLDAVVSGMPVPFDNKGNREGGEDMGLSMNEDTRPDESSARTSISTSANDKNGASAKDHCGSSVSDNNVETSWNESDSSSVRNEGHGIREDSDFASSGNLSVKTRANPWRDDEGDKPIVCASSCPGIRTSDSSKDGHSFLSDNSGWDRERSGVHGKDQDEKNPGDEKSERYRREFELGCVMGKESSARDDTDFANSRNVSPKVRKDSSEDEDEDQKPTSVPNPPPGNESICVKSESGESCPSQQQYSFRRQNLLSSETRVPSASFPRFDATRKRSPSAYFYSDSDDDTSLW